MSTCIATNPELAIEELDGEGLAAADGVAVL